MRNEAKEPGVPDALDTDATDATAAHPLGTGAASTSPWSVAPRRFLLALAGVGLLLGSVAISANTADFPEAPEKRAAPSAMAPPPDAEEQLPVEFEGRETFAQTDSEPFVLPRWVLVIIVIALGLWGLLILSRQRISLRFRRAAQENTEDPIEPDEDAHAAEVVRVTRDLIEDLRAIDDPRLAVMHAYASAEDGFGVRNMGRRPAETPQKYMERIFGQRAGAKEPLSRLTGLFEIARFSKRPINEAMRQDAIDALAAIRDSYRRTGPTRLINR